MLQWEKPETPHRNWMLQWENPETPHRNWMLQWENPETSHRKWMLQWGKPETPHRKWMLHWEKPETPHRKWMLHWENTEPHIVRTRSYTIDHVSHHHEIGGYFVLISRNTKRWLLYYLRLTKLVRDSYFHESLVNDV